MQDERNQINENSDFWNDYISQIDDRIADFFSQGKESFEEKYSELETNIRDWMNQQHLDDRAKAEWDKLKADSRLLKEKIRNRAEHLAAAGRIKLAEWKEQVQN
jgi:dsDNA-specific endonuclease/ATPase MutS2